VAHVQAEIKKSFIERARLALPPRRSYPANPSDAADKGNVIVGQDLDVFYREQASAHGMVRPRQTPMPRANPGKISYASAGSGTSLHMAGELFKMMAGVGMMRPPRRICDRTTSTKLASP